MYYNRLPPPLLYLRCLKANHPGANINKKIITLNPARTISLCVTVCTPTVFIVR